MEEENSCYYCKDPHEVQRRVLLGVKVCENCKRKLIPPNNNQSEEVERIVRKTVDEISHHLYEIDADRMGGVYDIIKESITTYGASEYARGKSEEGEKQKYNVKEYDEVVYILKSSGGKTYEASIPPLKWYEMGKLGLRTYKPSPKKTH